MRIQHKNILHLFPPVICSFVLLSASAQNAENIINELKGINTQIAGKPCNTKSGMAISNRAMNVFLADKTGYLSEKGDLSLYTNYVTLHSSAGTLTVNHYFQNAKGTDEPLKSLFRIGVEANIADGFNTTWLDKKFKNELGFTLSQTWIGKVTTTFADCSNSSKQKQAMDALRAGILHSLEMDINKKETDFKAALLSIDSADVPGQDLSDATNIALQNFYEDLKGEYEEKFARLQAETLTKTKNFRHITTNWTTISCYIPLFFPSYNIATNLTTPLAEKHPCPFELSISHTRLWESSKAGRLFITVKGRLLANNAVRGFMLDKTDYTQYKNLGGTDTLRFASLKTDEAYLGSYKTFLTPALSARAVYFPTDSHVGFSVLLEKNFGNCNLLNGRLGIPIVLINSKRLPAMNFEFQIAFFDMTHKISNEKKFGNKTSIGVGVGIPFSRLMF